MWVLNTLLNTRSGLEREYYETNIFSAGIRCGDNDESNSPGHGK